MHNHVGDYAKDISLCYFSDANFAGDRLDSKSTTGGFIALVGSHTFVPLTWLCKKQSAVSHSSAESEFIALEAGLRMLCMPMLLLWDTVISMFHGTKKEQVNARVLQEPYPWAENVDWVPPTVPPITGLTKIVVCEDNDAVLKMLKRDRTPKLLHVARTHRVNLLFAQQAMKDPAYRPRYIKSAEQIADMFTKGSHTAQLWSDLLARAQIQPASKFKTTSDMTIQATLKAAADAADPSMQPDPMGI